LVLGANSCLVQAHNHEHRELGPLPAQDPLRETYQGYAAAFQKAAATDMTTEQLIGFNRDYNGLIAPRNTEAMQHLTGKVTPYFTMERLKSEPYYKATISKLINSPNVNHRMLAYMTVASANDSSFNPIIWRAARTETADDALFWIGTTLLYLKDPHTTDLFDFLVAHEDFGDAHMLPLYTKLDKSAIKSTAYDRINSKEPKARLLAIQTLSLTDPDPTTEKLIKSAFATTEGPTRGYLVYTMKALKIGNLKSYLQPLLTDPICGSIAFAALLESPTAEDRACAESSYSSANEVPKSALNAYLQSKNPEHVRKFLILVRDRKVPANYQASPLMYPLLCSPEMRAQLCDTISKTHNRQIVPSLMFGLPTKKDSTTLDLLRRLAVDPDPEIKKTALQLLN
jgi:hypothetical protein